MGKMGWKIMGKYRKGAPEQIELDRYDETLDIVADDGVIIPIE